MKDTETMNKLFLEMSQFVTAKTARELKLEAALELILPMAKGYAAEHPGGANQRYVERVSALVCPTDNQEE